MTSNGYELVHSKTLADGYQTVRQSSATLLKRFRIKGYLKSTISCVKRLKSEKNHDKMRLNVQINLCLPLKSKRRVNDSCYIGY